MNGIHDIGGMDNIGPLDREENEPVFHEDWERLIFADTLAMLGAGYFKTDEIRSAIEWMPPADYLNASYYEKWLYGLSALLVKKKVLTEAELAAGHSLGEGGMRLPPLPKEAAEFVMTNPVPASADVDVPPRFQVGDEILTKNINPTHHTRLPRYVRGKRGLIEKDYGVFPLPDAVAQGESDRAQHVYSVRFTARELWGGDASARDSLYIDLFDDYMEPI